MDARVKPAHDELVKQLKLAPMGSSPRVTRVGERALNEHDGIMLPLIGQSAALVGRRRAGADPAESSTRSCGTADTTVSEAVVARHGSSSLSERTNCPCGGMADAAVPKAAVFSRRAGSSPARGTNSRVWRKRKTQDTPRAVRKVVYFDHRQSFLLG